MCDENSCGCSNESAAVQTDQPGGVHTEYQVAGMTCGGCASRVSEQLADVPGVSAVNVDVAAGTVRVTSRSGIADDAVDSAVQRAGYHLVR